MILMIGAIILAILIYSAICFYIGYNGWVWLKARNLIHWKKVHIVVVVGLSLSVFAGQLLPIYIFKIVSGLWLAVVGYSLIILPIINLLVYLIGKKSIVWAGNVVGLLYIFILIYGSFLAWNPTIHTFDIQVDKSNEQRENLKILMASDIHAGVLVGNTHLEKLVSIAEKEKPDIILIPGDLIDDYIEPYLKQDMGKVMEKLSAPLGVYAVLGNHDYYGDDTKQLLTEMDKAGITVLTDEWVEVENFYLIGRKDPTDESRRPLKEFIGGIDKSKPLIMLDHQPIDFSEASENGMDVMLSGHTHRGQLFPASIVTNLLYENDYGYEKMEQLHTFVSSGFGVWGPPLRLGTQSEVFVINIEFKQ
jgi:uncharacterized protein